MCELSLTKAALTDEGLAAIGRLNGLRVLTLEESSVTDKGLEKLVGLHRLDTLFLSHNDIRGSGLKPLTVLTQLRFLGLAESLTDEGMANLAKLRMLKKLVIDYIHELPDASYARLGELAELNELTVVNTDQGLGPEALAGLGRIRKLRRLDLCGERVTDAGLEQLAGLKDLQDLILNNTSVSIQGVQQLKKRLMTLRVELTY